MRCSAIPAIVLAITLPIVPALAQGPWQPPASGTTTRTVTVLTRTPQGATFRIPGGILSVVIWRDRMARVSLCKDGRTCEFSDLAIIGAPARVAWTMAAEPDGFVITTPAMRLTVNADTGSVALLDAKGAPLVSETDPDRRLLGDTANPDGQIQQRFQLYGAQAIHGLGQHQTGRLDYTGTTVRLQQANTDVGVPVLVSSAGFGIFWNNPAVTDVDVSIPQATDRIVFRSQAGSGIDYFLFAGPDVDAVIGSYRQLTGQAPMMARWTFGLWQSKERYRSQAELLAVAAKYRDLGIPLDAVVQDWQYWKPGEWGSHRLDPTRYPDGKAMLDRLHRQNVHSIVSIWPRFDAGLDTTMALDAIAGLYPKTYPNVYPAGTGRWYDAFSPAARALYWRQVSDRLGAFGFDGYWLDGSEAELGGHWGEMRDVTTARGSGAIVYNAYPLLHTSAVHDGMARDYLAKRPILLTRSAWAGQQRNAAITWSGDVAGRWNVFRAQVPAGVNFSMTGIPYWSADIGGFFGGDPKDAGYQQLFTRWLQFAVFNPMFRIHGTGAGKELYSFPQAARAPLLDAVKLRYRLMPFLYAQAWQVTAGNASFLYPVDMLFPGDPHARDLPSQFMFGRSIMASPVVEENAITRQVYLPAGSDWYDFWTGKREAGGSTIVAAAPLARMPLHIKAGTILPLGAPVQFAAASVDQPIELRVYRGADGHFTLYDDAGDGPAWRQGAQATVALTLDDKAGILVIGKRQGQYPGMRRNRIFRVVTVSERAGTGLSETAVHDIRYDGHALSVRLD